MSTNHNSTLLEYESDPDCLAYAVMEFLGGKLEPKTLPLDTAVQKPIEDPKPR